MLRLTELKHSTTNFNITSMATGGTIVTVSDLSQGTSSSTRVGNQVHVSYLEVFGQFSLAAAQSGDIGRLIIFVDHSPDGALPGVTDVLESTSYASCYNKDKVGSRFRILHDGFINLMNSAPTVT